MFTRLFKIDHARAGPKPGHAIRNVKILLSPTTNHHILPEE